MSRVKKAQESAVSRLTTFIFEIRGRIANNERFTFSPLYERYNISKGTKSSLIKLGYIIEDDGVIKWLNPKNHSDRVIALFVLELSRERQQKTVDAVKLPGMAAYVTEFKEILTEIRDNLKTSQSGVQGFKMREKPQTLFAESDTKEATRVKILCAIITASYFDGATNDSFMAYSDSILKNTDTILSKLYSK